jgi:hypothetical protein
MSRISQITLDVFGYCRSGSPFDMSRSLSMFDLLTVYCTCEISIVASA